MFLNFIAWFAGNLPGAKLPAGRAKLNVRTRQPERRRFPAAVATSLKSSLPGLLQSYSDGLLVQAKLAAGLDADSTSGHKYILAAVHSLGARDGLEVLLAVQMVSVHTLGMHCLANAAAKEQTDVGREVYINRANRLLRTFAAQVQALKSYRSRGEQHFTVEHVHVHSGGQAARGRGVSDAGGGE